MRIPRLRDDPSVDSSQDASFPESPSRDSSRPAGEAGPEPPSPDAPDRRPGRASLASAVSALALVGLVGGLGYGAYALVLDLQRVGFAPLPVPHSTFAEAPLIAPPEVDWARAPDASVGPGDLSSFPTRDGPISAIDPETSGLFAPRHTAGAAKAAAAAGAGGDSPPGVRRPDFRTPDGPNGGFRVALSPEEAELAAPLLAGLAARPARIVLHATDEAWVRVRDGEAVIFEGILPPGGQYELPRRAESPVLRAGNAGALYVLVEDTPYGPVGTSRAVLKNMPLDPEEIAARAPQAHASAVCGGPGAGMLVQAAASVGQ